MNAKAITQELWLTPRAAINDTRHAITKQVATIKQQFETDYGTLVLTQQERATVQACLIRLLERRLVALEAHGGPALGLMDHDDSLTLCREHLEHAEALFYSITKLLDSPAPCHQAKHLSRLGSQLSASALTDINGQLAALEAQACEQQSSGRANG